MCPSWGTVKNNRSGIFPVQASADTQTRTLADLGVGSLDLSTVYGAPGNVPGFYNNYITYATQIEIAFDMPASMVSGHWFVGSMTFAEWSAYAGTDGISIA